MQDLELLLSAAKTAGEIALKYHNKSPESWEKADGAGPVSAADLEVDAYLQEQLRAARPGYGWISEESSEAPSTDGTGRSFIVDPIDGTRAFLEGSPNFAVALAVVENGIPLTAVVAMPAKERVYSAQTDQGAFRDGEKITASTRETLKDATILTPRPTLKPENWHTLPPVQQNFRSSLAYRLALVAEGRFDMMVTLRKAWVWDIVAGDLIAREAGAVVSDQYGAPLRFDAKSRQVDGVLATGSNLHKDLLTHLRG